MSTALGNNTLVSIIYSPNHWNRTTRFNSFKDCFEGLSKYLYTYDELEWGACPGRDILIGSYKIFLGMHH